MEWNAAAYPDAPALNKPYAAAVRLGTAEGILPVVAGNERRWQILFRESP